MIVTTARMGLTCTYSGRESEVIPRKNNDELTDDAALQEKERIWVTDIHFWPEYVPGEYRVLGRSAMQGYQ